MATNYRFGQFRLDADSEVLFRGTEVTGLGRRPVALLRVLVHHAGAPVSKDALIAAAWRGLSVEESNLPVQIAALRRVLAEEAGGETWIETLPRRGYRFAGPAVAVQYEGAMPPASATAGQAAGDPCGEQPSIAVLPFANLSGTHDQQSFGDAIADDIITALTRFRWFFVVARQSSFAFRDCKIDVREIASRLGVRYVLEGSHRQAGTRVRITAQLIDAASGSHIWAERYERDLADIFAIQDDIADSVVGAIEPELLKRESRVSAACAGDMTAWDLIRRGIWYFHHVAPDTHVQARDLFRAAAKLEPRSPDPHIWLARVSGGIALWGWSREPEAICQEGLSAALTAISLDEKNPYAHYGLAITSCGANRLNQAERAAERAIALSPSFALAHLVCGMATLYLGKAEEAKSALKHGLRLNIHDPHNFVWFDLLALAHLFTGEIERAVEAATQALKIRPASNLTLQVMAICASASGRANEARQCLTAARQVSAHPIAILAPLKARNPKWRDEIERLLHKAMES
ncbi:winged helix-turn-helix domain-containing tetratricopeptide repeat protein [Bradyrhizobium sp. DASA03005]|uniref:winged helix-turn-helix domain-containing tetratricopeptide repeat protein n=1 Tax=Bradyrhizobium sp. SPXBL-02 TaxID=3395912 RepID=UPI003F6F4523